MWLLVSFDIPSGNGHAYRRLRKILIANGFFFFQCSVCRRWVHSREKMEAIRKNVEKAAPPGKLLFLHLPEASFSDAFSWVDGVREKMPDPPEQWDIF